MKVKITDKSSTVEWFPLGYVVQLCKESPPINWKPHPITNWWQYEAMFGHDLTNIRIYREGYLDKVMVSGVNRDGERVKIYLDKYPKRYKRDRHRWFRRNNNDSTIVK